MKAKKKLLIYSDCYIYGGSERLLAFIILNPVMREKYEIHFAYRRHPAYEAGLREDYGPDPENFHPLFVLSNDTILGGVRPRLLKKMLKAPFWCLQKCGLYFLYNFFIMRSFIKKIGPDVIHVNNGGYPGARSCAAFVFAAREVGVKNIVYQVNNIATPPKTRFSAWVDRNVDKSVRYFITASRTAREALARERNFPLDKIVALPNTTFDRAIIGAREKILKEFSWPADSFLLCEVGLLSQRKGQIFLLEALQKIKLAEPALFKNTRLVFVGNGEDEDLLKKFVHDNGLDAHVAFAGYRADRLDFIGACDIFILPSIASEDMPIVILEAMSMGKAIIASDFAGIKEEIENGVSGILIRSDVKTLSSDLTRAIMDVYGSRAVAYGSNAKKRFDDLFSIERYGHRLMNVYNSTNE